jgi:S-adenosyl-L-methionine hydrolase (adenosine-forming)
MIITLTTDFGLKDAFVGIMKGVIATINPRAKVVDLTHGIPAQNITLGALSLRQAVPYFPHGTIHVGIVDPGVGTHRLPLLIACGGSYFIGPDNGLLSLAIGENEPNSITCLSNPEYHRRPTSASFHGRDIFAPVAAHLSCGVPVKAFGHPLPQFVRLLLPKPRHQAGEIRGQIIYIDHFGNLFTNIEDADLAALPGSALEITCCAGFHITGIVPNYGSGQERELIAIKNSWGVLEIAIPGGNAQQHTGAKIGDQVGIAVRH